MSAEPAPTRYIAFLKGINVGTAKRLPMADLRAMLTGCGYEQVVTHLQSGNAIFTSSACTAQVVQSIEQGLVRECGVTAKVVVRTSAELAAAVKADPFSEVAVDPSRHILGLFSAQPTVDALASFAGFIA